MKLMTVILFCMLTASCSIYTHNNQTLVESIDENGVVTRSSHFHDLNIISWRKLNEGALNISKDGAIKGSADKLDTDVESVKLLNNVAKIGVKMASPATESASVVKELIE